MIKLKRSVAVVIVFYLAVGFLYQMAGEFRLARKYGRLSLSALVDPYAYLRSVVFAPQWPVDMYWTFHHCGNVFTCREASE